MVYIKSKIDYAKKKKRKNQVSRVAIERTVSREPLYQLDKISEGNRAGNSCGSLKYLSEQPGCKQRSREKGWAVPCWTRKSRDFSIAKKIQRGSRLFREKFLTTLNLFRGRTSNRWNKMGDL